VTLQIKASQPNVPVLIRCRLSECEGVVLESGVYDAIHEGTQDEDFFERGDTPVRVLPPDALSAITDRRRRATLERRFGQRLKDADYDGLLALQAWVDLQQYESRISAEAITAQERELFARWLEIGEYASDAHLSESDRDFIEVGIKGDKYTRSKNRTYYFGEKFGNILRDVQFVVWLTKDECLLAPGLYCPTLLSGLMVLIAVGLVHVKGISVCKNCGKRFVRQRRWMSYCSESCGNAVRKRRQREKEKTKS
jgi:hypothetical protein